MWTARVVGTGLRVPPVPAPVPVPPLDGPIDGVATADAEPGGADVAAGADVLAAGVEGAALVGEVLTEAGAALAEVVGPAAREPLATPQPEPARATATARATGVSDRAVELLVRGKGTDLLERSCG
jgi:hypothetical protein